AGQFDLLERIEQTFHALTPWRPSAGRPQASAFPAHPGRAAWLQGGGGCVCWILFGLSIPCLRIFLRSSAAANPNRQTQSRLDANQHVVIGFPITKLQGHTLLSLPLTASCGERCSGSQTAQVVANSRNARRPALTSLPCTGVRQTSLRWIVPPLHGRDNGPQRPHSGDAAAPPFITDRPGAASRTRPDEITEGDAPLNDLSTPSQERTRPARPA